MLAPGPPPSLLHPQPMPGDSETASGRTEVTLIGPAHNVPLVHARVAGQPTLMLVDTGAYDHLLEGWFARELQDGTSSGKTGAVIDLANRTMPLERWTPVSFALDGWAKLSPIAPLATQDVMMWPRAMGIGGILSPQKLARGGTVVIDFPRGEMLLVDAATAASKLAALPKSLGVSLRCGAAFALPASVEAQAAHLVVDTGSFSTQLKASSPPGRALVDRTSVSRDVYAVGGAVKTRALGDARLTVGELHTKADVAVMQDRPRASRCPSDGVLGMDVLAHCVLAVDEMKMRVSCEDR